MDLKLKDKDVLIEGVALPIPLQISLEKRGKTVVNHRYVEDVKELQVLCSSCNQWHSTCNLEGGAWVDINKTYKLCNKGKHNEYFDTYCLQCYESKKNKDTKIIEQEPVVMAEIEEKCNVGKERIQQTVFLYPDNDLFIKLYCVFQNKKKNQLINEIIAEFKANNPINL
ncbi:hypothetical protein BTO30_16175 [Domibacillus antri]|uniref:Uncharacterized protein n=1 Tax=Domibacillus antri TaxID=1714264 RepID=A0A1Q8Q1M4_9BACI|nr:hypothetical protein [Domibacillus antri]OLN21215.1 hypothetical protein BTO30_16175 [Domibacillus antri]